MVVTDFPARSRIGVEQERMASPLRWTVHAPQRPTPQPNLVPVMSSSSRRYHSKGISGSPPKERSLPLILSLIIYDFPSCQPILLVCDPAETLAKRIGFGQDAATNYFIEFEEVLDIGILRFVEFIGRAKESDLA